ncbi:hypothetical protein BDW59DRAFT_147087 [Aspergillus cavernicola]|uniref:Uncharacterized protein n=1 Tax=Aspergillus cavernicola TaxID=176166 RepID=A0ABR4IAK6_9EURO
MTSSDSHPFGSNDAKSPDVDLLPPSFRGSDSADAQGIDLKSSSRLYHIYHTAIRYDYRVLDADKNHLYFVYNSLWTPIKEDITVHAGEYNHAPVVGVCKFLPSLAALQSRPRRSTTGGLHGMGGSPVSEPHHDKVPLAVIYPLD